MTTNDFNINIENNIEEVVEITLPPLNENGTVLSVKDGIAFIDGLDNSMMGELLHFPRSDVYGMALNLEQGQVGAILFSGESLISQGDICEATSNLANVKVGDYLLGRVVDGLGRIIDSEEELSEITDENTLLMNIERKAPGVITRLSVSENLLTGYKCIDCLLPIGRGQRELIIGDRQTGKTTLAIDSILAQSFFNTTDDIEVYAIYVGIGQKNSNILNLKTILTDLNAFYFSIIVFTSAADSAALQYLAPYTGCTIAEFYRDHGKDALIIYDDLTKHAASYRQLSLLLRRPLVEKPFRETSFILTHAYWKELVN